MYASLQTMESKYSCILVPSASRLKMSLTSSSGCTQKFEFFRFSDHVTKRNGGSGEENGIAATIWCHAHEIQSFDLIKKIMFLLLPGTSIFRAVFQEVCI